MRSRGSWEEEIRRQLLESAEVQRLAAEVCYRPIFQAASAIADSLRQRGKLLLCGNGGSAADAQHIAAELIGRLGPGRERVPLAALALTTDTSALTALGNDYGFAAVFQRQVAALGRPGDVLLAISTSGRSENVLRAVAEAREVGMTTIGLSGGDGGPLANAVDIKITVPSRETTRIQEAHIAIGHVICWLVESLLFGEGKEEALWATGRISG